MSCSVARPAGRRRAERPLLDPLAQLLDLGAVDGALAADDLEAVVLRRIVAGGDHHAAVGAQVKDREVEPRRMDHADVDDVDPGRQQLALEGGMDARRRDPAVPPQRDAAGARVGEVGAGRAAEVGHEVVGEVALGDATDVVLAKDSGVHGHDWGLFLQQDVPTTDHGGRPVWRLPRSFVRLGPCPWGPPATRRGWRSPPGRARRPRRRRGRPPRRR